MPKTPGEKVQDEMERYRGPQKAPRPQAISKPNYPVHKPTKQIHKSSRGR